MSREGSRKSAACAAIRDRLGARRPRALAAAAAASAARTAHRRGPHLLRRRAARADGGLLRSATTASADWRLRDPDAIVLHYTAGDSYSSAWNTFESNAPEPRRAARRLRPLRGQAERHDRRAGRAPDPLPARDRAQPPLDRHRDGPGGRPRLRLGRSPDPRAQAPDPRRPAARRLAPGPVRDRHRRRDRPLDGQRQPLLQGPPGLAQRPHRLAREGRARVPQALARL